MENIDNPYPIEGTVTPGEAGYRSNLPCESEWLTEREGADILQAAVDRARSAHGNGTAVDVRWNEDGSFELLGRADGFALVETYTPDTAPVQLEIGLGGTCNECDTELVDGTTDEDEARLRCPDCGLLAGLVIYYPDVEGDGEPASDADADWPFRKEGWDIEDGRLTVTVGVRGVHTDCDAAFAENTTKGQFGKNPLACTECDQMLGWATQMNVLEDPLLEATADA